MIRPQIVEAHRTRLNAQEESERIQAAAGIAVQIYDAMAVGGELPLPAEISRPRSGDYIGYMKTVAEKAVYILGHSALTKHVEFDYTTSIRDSLESGEVDKPATWRFKDSFTLWFEKPKVD